MNETDLRNWLRRADEALAGRESLRADAQACRQILARRVRNRRVIVASAGLVACVTTAIAFTINRPDARPRVQHTAEGASETNVASVPRQLSDEQVVGILRRAASYSQRAAVHKRIVDLLRQEERLAERQRELRELEVSATGQLPADVRVQEEINRLAATQIVVAKRIASDFNDRQLAADAYRLVIAKFPKTRWSVVAAESLAVLESSM